MKTLPRYKLGFWGLLNFPTDPLKYFQNGFKSFGDTYKMGFVKDYLISRDPEVFKHVLVNNPKNYHKGEAAANLGLVLGNGLLTSEGDFWLRQRRLAQPAFHREKLLELFNTMGSITSAYLKELEKERGHVINVDEKMMEITADIALKTLFSTITTEDKIEIYKQINSSQEYIITRLRRPYLKPFFGILGLKNSFEKSLKIFNKMPKNDVFLVIIVALITVLLHNLALAVLIGVVISALVFAWESAKRIRAKKYIDDQ